MTMMKYLLWGGLVVIVLAMIPPAIIARMRAVDSDRRRIHIFQDMDNQPKSRAQHENDHFADDTPLGLGYELVFETAAGREVPRWLDRFPSELTVDLAFVERGRGRYEIYCMLCHGAAGYGDGIVHQRANGLVENAVNGTSWVAPKSLHEAAIREQPIG
jgi:hypothetical protein